MSQYKIAFERNVAIREGHKIHSETSYFTPRPQLDFENARHVFGEGFDRGYIAATAEANNRINALESEVAELKADQFKEIFTNERKQITELQASNNHLREALESLLAANKITHSASTPETVMQAELQMDKIRNAVTKANEALSSTPVESLQAHDNEVK